MTEEEFKKNAKTIPTNIETEEKIALDYFKYKVLPTTNSTAFESKEEHYTKMVLNVIEKLQKENEELKYENLNLKQEKMIDNSSCKPLNNFFDYYDCIPKDKIRKLEDMWNDNIWNATDEESEAKAEMIRDVYRGLLDE